MIIIDKFRLAYLHINKTAGTSIKGYFEDHAGPENIKQMGATHGPLAPTIRIMGNRFHDYNILTSIRNPFARVVSMYAFRRKRYSEGDCTKTTEAAARLGIKKWFSEVVVNSDRFTDLSITDSILVGGELLPNVHIIAVETIQQDMYHFCTKVLGWKKPKQVPHLNKTQFALRHYNEWVDDELKEMIYEWDQWVIDEYYPWVM